MTDRPLPEYRVKARNASANRENRIHGHAAAGAGIASVCFLRPVLEGEGLGGGGGGGARAVAVRPRPAARGGPGRPPGRPRPPHRHPPAAGARAMMTWWLWVILGFALMGLELFTPVGFYFLFFGVGALVVGLLVGLGLAGPTWMVWLAFSVGPLLCPAGFRGPL